MRCAPPRRSPCLLTLRLRLQAFEPLRTSSVHCEEIFVSAMLTSTATLDYFVGMRSATKFHVLTENIQGSSRLKRDIAAFEKEHGVPIELRVSAPGKLHDRYVLHADGMLLVRASLKDIAKKQSVIVALSNSMARDVEKGFGRFWNDATK